MEQATKLVQLYSDTILKKIAAKIQADQKKKTNAEDRAMRTAETDEVRTMRHWRAVGDNEFYYEEIQSGFRQLRELDDLTGWSEKLHQDRFKFMTSKYMAVLNEYEKAVKR